ncbi:MULTISPECIES: hypothetical protein [unclassified Streptomyces]|uniref:hypothetical protein n=1 Tax=unclassified Streptomyces TaxID=2593676 RepID=UPI0033A6E313
MNQQERETYLTARAEFATKRRELDEVWPIDQTEEELTDKQWAALEEVERAAVAFTAARDAYYG